MIEIKQGNDNHIEVIVQGKLLATDFEQMQDVTEQLLKKYRAVKILVNSTGFEGWEDIISMQKHFNFVQSNHAKVEKVAVLIGPWWQNLMICFAKMLVHPKIKIFEASELAAARQWLNE